MLRRVRTWNGGGAILVRKGAVCFGCAKSGLDVTTQLVLNRAATDEPTKVRTTFDPRSDLVVAVCDGPDAAVARAGWTFGGGGMDSELTPAG